MDRRRRTGAITRTLRPGAAALLLTIGATAVAAAQEAEDGGRIAVDRWLVSSPFAVRSDEDPLGTDRLSGPGEVAVLPDRGRTVAGADWTLVRRDSALTLDLEDRRTAADSPVVVYAHAYLRSVRDRTVSLTWGGVDCTAVSAWLNGRSLTDLGRPRKDGEVAAAGPFEANVRMGRGYNTLLLKAVSGDCAFGLTAWIEPAGPTDGLAGIRVQASRPYGDTRTGPAPWVLADRDAGPERILGWQDDRLYGAAGVRLAAFAVTAIEEVELKAKVDGEEVKRKIDWLTPAEPETILMPFDFEALRGASVGGEGMQTELKWNDGEVKSALRLDPGALLDAFHSSIRLLGWTVRGEEASAGTEPREADLLDADGEPHPLAHLIPLPGSGVTLTGEWKVPGWLSGFTLELDVEGAPGEYRLDSQPVSGDRIVLCTECGKGAHLQLVVRTTDAWERFPGVRIAGVTPPVAGGPVEAAGWLQRLDEKGSRAYRERLEAGP